MIELQPSLFASTIDEQFDRFHDAHPDVYAELVDLTRQAHRAGRRRIGIKMLFEVLRWNRVLRGLPDDAESFKLNNNYTSRYARLIMDANPDLAGMFETRSLTS